MSERWEVRLADIAADQWGMVTTSQAAAVGVHKMGLSRLAGAGLLVRVGHGVYAMRGATAGEHLELAAAWLAVDPARRANERLACDPGGVVVSHASAAVLHGFGDIDADRHELTTRVRKQTRRADVRLHRAELPADDVTTRGGLPVTTPERTVVDLLGDGRDGEHVAGVLADAVRSRRVDLRRLVDRIGPYAGRYGVRPRGGHALLDHLLELGGATELAAADALAEAARVSRTSVVDMLDPQIKLAALARSSPHTSGAINEAAPRAIETVARTRISDSTAAALAGTAGLSDAVHRALNARAHSVGETSSHDERPTINAVGQASS